MEASHQHYIQQINELKERLAIELSRNHALATSATRGAHSLSFSYGNSSNASLIEQTYEQTSDNESHTRFKAKSCRRHRHRAIKHNKELFKPRHVAVDFEAPSGSFAGDYYFDCCNIIFLFVNVFIEPRC